MKYSSLVFLAFLAFLVAGCQRPNDPPSAQPPLGQSLVSSFAGLQSGELSWVEGSEAAVNRARNLQVQLTLPPSGDVYFLYTNVANDASVQTLGGVTGDRSLPTPPRGTKSVSAGPEPRTELTRLHSSQLPVRQGSRSLLPANDIPSNPVVGATAHFTDSLWATQPAGVNRHPMTLKVVQADTTAHRTLYVWVVDDCFDGSAANAGTRFKVTLPMVEALANKFLDPNSTTDIYGLVTGLLGPEWIDSGEPKTKTGGSYGGQLIDGNQQIHIVLGDLNPTDDPTKRRFGGGMGGYFHGWNNYKGAESNERILFAVDANGLANPDLDGVSNAPNPEDDSSGWSLENSYYPNDVVATLAHELQHMIQFYQKSVLNGTGDADAWINEMASMAVEDLVADQVGFSGPRGLPGNDYTTGDVTDYWVSGGRLPLFNGTHEQVPLQAWWSGLDSLPNYSNAYAFGAWLTRNYGGAAFWRDLVQSPGTKIQAVIDAANAHRSVGEPVQTYSSLVRNWGLAVFLGNQTPSDPFVAPLTFAATSGGAFEYALGATYKTGSIDLYHYPMAYLDSDYQTHYYTDQNDQVLVGPSRWSSAPSTSSTLAAGATWISYIGTGSGSWSRTVSLPPSVVVTVVVKRP